MNADLRTTLARINWHYGKGDLLRVGKGVCVRRTPIGQNTARYDYPKYSIDGKRVTFLGQTRTLGYQPR